MAALPSKRPGTHLLTKIARVSALLTAVMATMPNYANPPERQRTVQKQPANATKSLQQLEGNMILNVPFRVQLRDQSERIATFRRNTKGTYLVIHTAPHAARQAYRFESITHPNGIRQPANGMFGLVNRAHIRSEDGVVFDTKHLEIRLPTSQLARVIEDLEQPEFGPDDAERSARCRLSTKLKSVIARQFSKAIGQNALCTIDFQQEEYVSDTSN